MSVCMYVCMYYVCMSGLGGNAIFSVANWDRGLFFFFYFKTWWRCQIRYCTFPQITLLIKNAHFLVYWLIWIIFLLLWLGNSMRIPNTILHFPSNDYLDHKSPISSNVLNFTTYGCRHPCFIYRHNTSIWHCQLFSSER